MAPKLSTSTIGYKSITVRFAWHVTRATQWRAAPRSSRKCWPHFWCFKAITFVLLSLSLLSLLQKQLTPFFYFLLSTLFNYTVRLMAPGMRVCKKKKITSARLNNYSPFFSTTTTSHHHHQYITSNKKKRNKNETSRNPLRETEIKLLPLFLVTIFKPDLTNKSGFTNIAIYGSILYILEVASFFWD